MVDHVGGFQGQREAFDTFLITILTLSLACEVNIFGELESLC